MIVPLTNVLSKTFLRPNEMPEEKAAHLLHVGLGAASLRRTSYYLIRTGQSDWTDPWCGCLPSDLDKPLAYWCTPFAWKPRCKPSCVEIAYRRLRFPFLCRRFRKIIQAIEASPVRWVGQPAHGILLVDGDREVVILLDGHHRVGAVCALYGMNAKVPVVIPPGRKFTWTETIRSGKGRFSAKDCDRLWRHCWERVYGGKQ